MVQLAFPFESEKPGAGPEAPTGPVPLRFITITWSESSEGRYIGRPFETWTVAEEAIRQMATVAPMPRAYDKTGFHITWADGETYEGRIDLDREMALQPCPLADHVRAFLLHSSGRKRPINLTEEHHRELLAAQEHHNPGSTEAAGRLLDTHQVGA
jgi:hypothetical protein